MNGLCCERVSKSFRTGAGELGVLDGIVLELAAGERIAITGPSGSGKSTLLHILGGLVPPTSGTVRVRGQDPYSLSERALARFRNQTIGFVFQDHHLLPQCSVLENVLLPTLAAGGATPAATERARELIERVALPDRVNHRPAELSGGERQRVAIARALINRPAVLLCDEPTGNLDRHSADRVAELLLELPEGDQTSLVIVTHSAELARRLPRRFELRDGRLHEVRGP